MATESCTGLKMRGTMRQYLPVELRDCNGQLRDGQDVLRSLQDLWWA